MTFAGAITSCMGKYATFSGRAVRSEFWWFYLFTVLLNWGSTIVGAATFEVGDPLSGLLPGVVSLVIFLPSLAVSTRRLHDTGRSGWWILLMLTVIGIIPVIIWWAKDSQPGANQYGPNPQGIGAAVVDTGSSAGFCASCGALRTPGTAFCGACGKPA